MITVYQHPKDVAGAVADRLARLVRRKPRAVVTFPTGSTMLPVYDEIVARTKAGELDLSGVRAIQLDEYAGVDDSTSASFRAWLREHLLEPAGIGDFRTLPATRPSALALHDFEDMIRTSGGVDLTILGIGGNGHIAFNEPGSAATSRTRVVELDRRTRQANEGYWSGAFVPTKAVTQGVGTILEARSVLLVATGAGKAEILREALRGPVTPRVPASLVRTHASAEVLADTAAAHLLTTDPTRLSA